MGSRISVVINTFNEESNIERCLKSVQWADEIVVCDMYSDDNTVHIAKKYNARVVSHKKTNFVEPARNFAISQAKGNWILILDADEELTGALQDDLLVLSSQLTGPDYVEIPRKNIIFGKWMQHSGWWPDYNIRFFKKGMVVWKNQIHSKPETTGVGYRIPAQEKYALAHHHYQNIPQFITRMNRYTDIQADEINNTEYSFVWQDLITMPLGEFLSRYFAHRGYLDGTHGLILALLQAFSQLILYVKIWELQRYPEQNISLPEFHNLTRKSTKEIKYWVRHATLSDNKIKRTVQKIIHKLT